MEICSVLIMNGLVQTVQRDLLGRHAGVMHARQPPSVDLFHAHGQGTELQLVAHRRDRRPDVSVAPANTRKPNVIYVHETVDNIVKQKHVCEYQCVRSTFCPHVVANQNQMTVICVLE